MPYRTLPSRTLPNAGRFKKRNRNREGCIERKEKDPTPDHQTALVGPVTPHPRPSIGSIRRDTRSVSNNHSKYQFYEPSLNYATCTTPSHPHSAPYPSSPDPSSADLSFRFINEPCLLPLRLRRLRLRRRCRNGSLSRLISRARWIRDWRFDRSILRDWGKIMTRFGCGVAPCSSPRLPKAKRRR